METSREYQCAQLPASDLEPQLGKRARVSSNPFALLSVIRRNNTSSAVSSAGGVEKAAGHDRVWWPSGCWRLNPLEGTVTTCCCNRSGRGRPELRAESTRRRPWRPRPSRPLSKVDPSIHPARRSDATRDCSSEPKLARLDVSVPTPGASLVEGPLTAGYCSTSRVLEGGVVSADRHEAVGARGPRRSSKQPGGVPAG